MADKALDIFTRFASEYKATKKPAIIHVGRGAYLTRSGAGDPSSQDFADAVADLFKAAYELRFAAKRDGFLYKVPKLEALWWSEDESTPLLEQPRENWQWKVLSRVPAEAAGSSRIEVLQEGPCVQALHVGPYETEMDTIAAMWEAAHSQGLIFHGAHHEIYLSDPRRTAPEKQRTIIRQPVAPHPAISGQHL